MLLPNGFTAQGLGLRVWVWPPGVRGAGFRGLMVGGGAFMELPTYSCCRGLLRSDG